MVSKEKFDRFPETPVLLLPVSDLLRMSAIKELDTLNSHLKTTGLIAFLFGSVALDIPGKGELEFKIYTNDLYWEKAQQLLATIYGIPVRVKYERVLYEYVHDGQEIEVVLVRGEEIAKDIWVSEKLSIPEIKEEYIGIKRKYSYSLREYHYQKALFFDHLLKHRVMQATPSIQRSDYSFGIIPIRYVDKRVEFLLIKHQLGHWGFPKGHPEGSETAQQAALRELQEETNLTVKKVHTKGPIIESYTFEWGEEIINKEVQYWLATVDGEIKLQEEEIQESRWLNYEEALERCEYKESKETLISAQKILSNSLSQKIFNS